jgi:hypothetical protein
VTTSLVSFHITSHAEGFTTACVRAFEWFFAGVTVAVNTQTAGTREGLVAGGANIAVLRLREGCLAGRADVVVVLPGIRAILCWPG